VTEGNGNRHLSNLRAAALFMLLPAFLFLVMAVLGGELSFSFAQTSFIAWGTSTAAVWLFPTLLPRWYGSQGLMTVSNVCTSCGKKQFVLARRCFDCRRPMAIPLKDMTTVVAILVGVGVYFVIMMNFGGPL
jgi:hypothetical protein